VLGVFTVGEVYSIIYVIITATSGIFAEKNGAVFNSSEK
jgi:hypothetical protein